MIAYPIEFIFVYGVDCMINLANLTGLSYYEVNALVFCIVWPLLTVGLLLLFVVQKVRLRRAERKAGLWAPRHATAAQGGPGA